MATNEPWNLPQQLRGKSSPLIPRNHSKQSIRNYNAREHTLQASVGKARIWATIYSISPFLMLCNASQKRYGLVGGVRDTYVMCIEKRISTIERLPICNYIAL